MSEHKKGVTRETIFVFTFLCLHFGIQSFTQNYSILNMYTHQLASSNCACLCNLCKPPDQSIRAV